MLRPALFLLTSALWAVAAPAAETESWEPDASAALGDDSLVDHWLVAQPPAPTAPNDASREAPSDDESDRAPPPPRRTRRRDPSLDRFTSLGQQLVRRNSVVGYIDTAIPMDQLRFRFDAAYGVNRPSRAEFFWPGKLAPGPGLLGETNVDYQDLSLYYEDALRGDFSLFVDLPFRLVDPANNPNTAGLGDMNAGFKWAFISTPDAVTTFQLRTYAPTGDGDRGLGTDHVSLEPALLHYHRFSPRLVVESELRDWIPIGGTPGFQGNVLRYGVGVGYTVVDNCTLRLTPVCEWVGWTVLGGEENVPAPPHTVLIESAAGDTIVNVKLGARATIGRTDLYLGYGRAVTGDVWYEDVLRFELRRRF